MAQIEDSMRHIRLLGTGRTELPNNTVHSSRFRAVTLVPRSLLEQFTRFSNVWFLLVTIFQLAFTKVSPVSGWDTLAPLGLMLLLSLAKDAYLFICQANHDRSFNSRPVLVWTASGFHPRPCGQLLVGQVVLIKSGERAPADLLLLACSGAEDICYVDSQDLTGIRSPQAKKPVKETQRVLKHRELAKAARRLSKLEGEVTVSQPDPDFDVFTGKVKLKGFPIAAKLTPANLFPQQAKLQTAAWALGLVTYTGPDTKVSLNGARQTRKVTALEKRVNRLVLLLFPLLLIPMLISATISTFRTEYDEETSGYFDKLVNFTLLYNNVIPISLFVSLDVVRLAQSFRLHKLHPGLRVRNTDICEEMGQIEYLITSKNGTLTDGSMRIRAISIGDKEYIMRNNGEIEGKREVQREQSISILDDSKVVFWTTKPDDTEIITRNLGPAAAGHIEFLKDAEKSEIHRRLMQALVICHCFAQTESGCIGDGEEVALASQSAALFRHRLVSRGRETMVIEEDGKEASLKVLGYTASFQQMKKTRVLVQWPDHPFALLFVKASGSALFDILSLSHDEKENLRDSLEEFQRKGLRTVLYACKVIPAEELPGFIREFTLATRYLYNREDRIDRLFSKVEAGSELLGLVGIEEILLPETKSVLQSLQQSGIQTWLASADSELSTVTTAFNSGLFPIDTEVVAISNRTDSADLHVILTKAAGHVIKNEEEMMFRSYTIRNDGERLEQATSPLARLRNVDNNPSSSPILRMATRHFREESRDELQITDKSIPFSMSIDGITLETALRNQDCRRLLTCLLFAAKGVVLHSLLPLQKALLVRLLHEHFHFRPITLAVGYSQADLPMLTEANVGVSLRSTIRADVSVDSFAMLKELILLQGRWGLQRTGKVVLLFVYKNFLLTLFLMTYSFFSDYQPPPLFPAGLIASYNVLFTTIPVLVIGVWDEDLSHTQVFSHPLIYQTGIQGKFLRYRDFSLFLALAICQTGIIAMTIAPSFSGIITKAGETECFILLGTLIFLAVVSAVLVQVSLQCSAVTWTYCCTVVVSLIMLYLFVITAGVMEWEDLEGVLRHLFESWTCVMRLVLAPAAACTFGYAVLAYLRLFYPSISDFIAQNPAIQTEIQPWSRLSEYSSDLRRVYKSSSRLEQVSELHESQLHPLSLRFSSPSMEKAYATEFSNQLMPLLRVVVAITIALLAAWMVYNVVSNTKTDTATSQSVMIAALLLVLVGSYLPGFRKYFRNVTLGVILTVILVKFLTELLFNRVGGLSSALIPVITFAILNVDFVSIAALNLLALCLISLSLVLSLGDSTTHVLYILITIVLLVGIFVTCVALGYYTSRLNRLHFQLLNSVNAEAEHVRSILCCFLPEFVRDRVRRGTRYIAEEKGVVTVLFCDICDFDAICANSTPVELTAFLDDLFQKFDMACERNGVFKVETVGKTYMTCAGLKETERNIPEELANTTHARRTIELAFHILRIAENYRLPSGAPVSVKIGINSGPVVAGVVGFHKPQFSLVGDTVNTASRMCSTLDSSNSIQISEATFGMIEDQRGIQFEPVMLKGVKGKGDMKAYRITEKTLSLGTDTASETEESDKQIKQVERVRASMTPEARVLRRMQTSRPIDTRKSMRIRCCGSPEERKFRLTILKDTLPVMRTGLIAAFVVRILILMLRVVAYDQFSSAASDECLIAYSISAGCTGLLALASTRLHQYRGYSFLVFCICLLSTVLTMCDFMYRTDYHEDVITLVVMYDIMVLTCCSGLYYWWTVLGSVLSVVIWSAVTPLVVDIGLHYSNLIFIIGFSVVNIYAAAAQEQQIRSHTSLEKYAEREIKETDELLSHLLPPHVYESLKQERNITESFSNVTILFADIVGFTSWSSNKTPVEVVTMLSELFTRFDKLCVGNEVYKVHTIGDCYVAMGYAGEGSQRDVRAECLNVLRQAFDMVSVINDINTQNGTSLNMRIGLHTGEVIAGITGSSVVRYDIYGPDVLIANKMESGGESGRVNVSDKTRGVMEGGSERFTFEFNKEIEAKAIARKHKSYFVTIPEGCLTQHLSVKSLNDEMSLAVKTKEETMIAEDLEHITLPT